MQFLPQWKAFCFTLSYCCNYFSYHNLNLHQHSPWAPLHSPPLPPHTHRHTFPPPSHMYAHTPFLLILSLPGHQLLMLSLSLLKLLDQTLKVDVNLTRSLVLQTLQHRQIREWYLVTNSSLMHPSEPQQQDRAMPLILFSLHWKTFTTLHMQ